MYLTESIIGRFWAKVNKTEDDSCCWLWTGSLNGHGYGQLNIGAGIRVQSHRLSYKLHFGKIPSKLLVCHRCNNKACVNPKHLYLGTPKINAEDAVKDGLIPSGSSHYSFISNETFIDNVLKLHSEGLTQAEIASRMECGQSHISRTLNGKRLHADRNKSIPDDFVLKCSTSNQN